MDIQTINLFTDYNEKANLAMNSCIMKLNDAQWNNVFFGYFNSIKSLCNHIYICDFNWLKRFSKLRSFEFINNQLFDQNIVFDKNVFENSHEYFSARLLLDKFIRNFSKELTSEDLSMDLVYTDSHDKEYKKCFGGLVLHMFNHETHHRGMISLYLENLQINNDFNSFNQIL
jgi:uncharacterized damage-inducible protein DinB